MKNKKVKLGILVLAAVALFTATAFAAAPGNEGYEALKQIMKDSKASEAYVNVTFDGTFQVTDNGKAVAEFKGSFKGNHEGREASGNLQVNMMDKNQNLTFYKGSETLYLVDENNLKYYQFINLSEKASRTHEYYSREDYSGNHSMGNTGEALMDYFMGDLKSQFELTANADGSKSISLDLDQNEIPVPVNLMAGLAVENKGDKYHPQFDIHMDSDKNTQLLEKFPFLKDFSGMENVIPELKNDVKLTAVYLKLDFDVNNKIKSFTINVNITGKDENGAVHDVGFSGTADIKDINNTIVDIFNPEGKNVEVIDCKEFQDTNNQY